MSLFFPINFVNQPASFIWIEYYMIRRNHCKLLFNLLWVFWIHFREPIEVKTYSIKFAMSIYCENSKLRIQYGGQVLFICESTDFKRCIHICKFKMADKNGDEISPLLNIFGWKSLTCNFRDFIRKRIPKLKNCKWRTSIAI